MKKIIFSLAFVLVSIGTMAQNTSRKVEMPYLGNSVVTNSFWSNWFVAAGIDYTASYSSQEVDVSKNPFSSKRSNIGFDLSAGKWFTPGLGLRTKLNLFSAKQVNTETSHPSFDYWNLHEDVLINFSNIFYGYNENRFWNFIPYVGLGVARNMSYNNYDISVNFGFLNKFRLNNRFSLQADLGLDNSRQSFDNVSGGNNSGLSLGNIDKFVNFSVGLAINIGKTSWNKTPDVDALMAMNAEQMSALNASLKEQQDENARIRTLLAKKKVEPKTKIVTKLQYITRPVSVFFNTESAKVASKKDLVNVKEMAEYAKANNVTLQVVGYADSKTGQAEYNNKLSAQRAQTIVDVLVDMGVNKSNIEVLSKGGVAVLNPYSYNRRATVCIK